MRCYGCSSGCGSADRSSCAASGAIATSKANRKRLLRRKDFHDFSGKMRYSLFYRIRDTTCAIVAVVKPSADHRRGLRRKVIFGLVICLAGIGVYEGVIL